VRRHFCHRFLSLASADRQKTARNHQARHSAPGNKQPFSSKDPLVNDNALPKRKTLMKAITEVITNHAFFHGMKPEHLAVLTEGAKAAQFNAGDVLFREGAPANQFYLILSGRIALEAHAPANGTVQVQTLGPGDLFGWSWLFPPFSWHFQARAIEPMDVIILNGAHLLITAERDHDFGYELMKRVAQVVIHRLQATRKQLLALQIESVLEG
jgi:CRP/FNR family cyclic AMP-dependent transcriptional regulator